MSTLDLEFLGGHMWIVMLVQLAFPDYLSAEDWGK